MQPIVLGIFFTDTFRYVQNIKNAVDFPFGEMGIKEYKNRVTDVGVIWNVHCACYVTDKIYFCLDKIRLPLDPNRSITCKELLFLLNHPEFLEKTEFWLKEKCICKTKVLSLIQKSIDQQLEFEDIDWAKF